MAKLKYYVTTPVFEIAASSRIEFLYTAILCDAIARHKRMCGFDVAHFTGSATHAKSFDRSGEKLNGERAVSAERNNNELDDLAALADIQGTHFGGTSTTSEHIHAVQTLLRRTMQYSHFALYKAEYKGRYCMDDRVEVSESEKPADCAVCGRPAKLISEERYFFRLSAFQGRLAALYKYRPEFVRPQFRSREIEQIVRHGLRDIPISRESPQHGVPWPDDPGQVVCARYSEVVSYISGMGFGKDGHGSDDFKRYWPADLHVIGKEALRSHAVDWPAFLMASELPVPRHIFAHGTLRFEQEGTASTFLPEKLLQVLGSDALRYCLLREVAYGEDANLCSADLVRRYNADLAGGFGNLAR